VPTWKTTVQTLCISRKSQCRLQTCYNMYLLKPSIIYRYMMRTFEWDDTYMRMKMQYNLRLYLTKIVKSKSKLAQFVSAELIIITQRHYNVVIKTQYCSFWITQYSIPRGLGVLELYVLDTPLFTFVLLYYIIFDIPTNMCRIYRRHTVRLNIKHLLCHEQDLGFKAPKTIK